MSASRQPILYLDFDGVLHPEDVWLGKKGPFVHSPVGHSLFEHGPLLEQLLEPHPNIGIVLSTSWVLHYGCAGAAKRLPPLVASRVIGATYHSRMNRGLFLELPRGLQVLGDVGRRRPSKWVAFDDTDEGWSDCGPNGAVLITNPALGIAAPGVAQRLSAMLADMASIY